MKKYAIFRHNKTKFKTMSQISNADKHNLRQIDVPNADSARDAKRVFGGDSTVKSLNAMLAKYDLKPRKNAALAMEYMMTFSPEMKDKMPLENWVDENIKFLQKEHGEGLLSVDLHLDESTPHLHAICAPLIQKEVRGKLLWRLSGVDFWKGRDKLSDRQTRYADAMSKFGLRRGIKGSKAHHTTIKSWQRMIASTLVNAIDSAKEAVKSLEDPLATGRRLTFPKLKEKFKSLTKKLTVAISSISSKDEQIRVLNENLEIIQHQIEHSQEDKLEEMLDKANLEIDDLDKKLSEQKELNTKILYETSDLIAIKDDRINVLENFIDKRQNSETKNGLEIDKSFKI